MSLDFGKLNFSTSFKPTSAFPIDARSYFESYDLAAAAAKTAEAAGSSNTEYYFGETVAVVENDIATLYTIQPNGTLSEVGGKIEINKNVFTMTADGELDLYGFASAVAGAQLLKGSDGKLSWVKPDETTVEGLQTAVQGLREDVDDLIGTVGVKANGDDIQASTGIFLELEAKADSADVYTKEAADNAIARAVAGADHLKRQTVASVDEIDVSAEGADKIIYMVTKEGSDGDHFDEYMVINGAVERVGDWAVDLSEYAKTADITPLINAKVDKVEGSRLMTNAEGTKLSGIEEGAQVNTIDTVDEAQFAVDRNKKLTLLDIAMGKVTGLDSALLGKVDKVEGKGLSTNDLTNELLAKINESDANVIEIVKMNGNALSVAADKSVDIVIPTASDANLGMVKSSADKNKVTVAGDGAMEVASLSISKLVQAEGEEFILNGGTAAK